MDEDWVVWGDSTKPIKEGTEEEVKRFVEFATPNKDLYIASPDGKEFIYEGNRWVEV